MVTVQAGVYLSVILFSTHCNGDAGRSLVGFTVFFIVNEVVVLPRSRLLCSPDVYQKNQRGTCKVSVGGWAKNHCCIDEHKTKEGCDGSVQGERGNTVGPFCFAQSQQVHSPENQHQVVRPDAVAVANSDEIFGFVGCSVPRVAVKPVVDKVE